MKADSTVILSSNGRYWQAFYYDEMGRRRAKSLGPKNRLSKRQAKVACDRLAAELRLNPAVAQAYKPPSLQDYLERYLNHRTDLKPATLELHRLTSDYLLAFFPGDIRINRMTRPMASDWRAALASGKLSLNSKRKKMAEPSVCIHVRNAKTMFNRAVQEDIILFNPFYRLKGTAREPDKDWKYVSLEELEALLEACPTWGWRLLIAMCRLAGLRRGEAQSLMWSELDWDNHRLHVVAQKTGKHRVVPIQSRLYQLLLEGFDEGQEHEARVCPISKHGVWRNFQVIRRRARLPRWKDAFKVMRRNCETDWAQEYPQYVVSAWIGHDIQVSARHYLQVPEELYAKAAGVEKRQTATRTATKAACEHDRNGEMSRK
ncbi:MAG: tyrosine-type recombinase/integrase [Planctomycetota bacterium]|jgi:integrase